MLIQRSSTTNEVLFTPENESETSLLSDWFRQVGARISALQHQLIMNAVAGFPKKGEPKKGNGTKKEQEDGHK